jgi:hypothetical protein
MTHYEIRLEPRDARGDRIRKRRAEITAALVGAAFVVGFALGYFWAWQALTS